MFECSKMILEDSYRNITTNFSGIDCGACCRNETVDHDKPTIVKIDILWYAVLALASFGGLLVSLISNIMIISIFSRTPNLRTPSSILVMNLSVSDLVYCIQMPIVIHNCLFKDRAFNEEIGCQVLGFLSVATAIVSIMTIAAMSVERCYVILYPISGRKKFSMNVALVVIALIWLYAFALCIPPLFSGVNRYVMDPSSTTCTLDYLTRRKEYKTYISVFFVLVWLLPAVTMIISYTLIIIAVRRSRKELSEAQNSHDHTPTKIFQIPTEQTMEETQKQTVQTVVDVDRSHSGRLKTIRQVSLVATTNSMKLIRQPSERKRFFVNSPLIGGYQLSSPHQHHHQQQFQHCKLQSAINRNNHHHFHRRRSLSSMPVSIQQLNLRQHELELNELNETDTHHISKTIVSVSTELGFIRRPLDGLQSLAPKPVAIIGSSSNVSLAGPTDDKQQQGNLDVCEPNGDNLEAGTSAASFIATTTATNNGNRKASVALSTRQSDDDLEEDDQLSSYCMPLFNRSRVTSTRIGESNKVLQHLPKHLHQHIRPAISNQSSLDSFNLKYSGSNNSGDCSSRSAKSNSKTFSTNKMGKVIHKRKLVEYRLAKMSFYLILLWIISWTPIALIAILNNLIEDFWLSPVAIVIASCLTKMGPAFDVFVYGISHPKIRLRFKRMLTKKPQRPSLSNNSQLT